MKTQNKSVLALTSVAAVLMLLGAFAVVWLVPRGPGIGSAEVTSSPGSSSVGSGPQSGGVQSGQPATQKDLSTIGAQNMTPSAAPIQDQPHITVRGTGSISAKPDIANMQVGVAIQKASLDEAQAEAATKMNAVMDQLKAAGVAEKDISTSTYNVEPVMNYRDNQPPTVTGFRVTNIVNVKLLDLTKAGKLIDDVVKSGANTLYGLQFGFSDPTAVMRQAREAAMNDAKAKAGQLAQLGGVVLGTPILIEEGSSNVPPPMMEAADSAVRSTAGAAPPPISPGQQEVRVEVSVIYGIK